MIWLRKETWGHIDAHRVLWRIQPLPKNTAFGELRASSVRDVLIYYRDHRCSHHVETNADGWPDDVRLSDIEPHLTCTPCGRRGADVRLKSRTRACGRPADALVEAVRRPDHAARRTQAQDPGDAATYIPTLPKAEAAATRWQTAMEMLLLVAERDGPEMFARIAMLQALNPGEPEPTPRKKRAKAYRVIR